MNFRVRRRRAVARFFADVLWFGVKAGLVLVNTWLPRAHPAAPANVSAILSGTILNLGLYGIVRMNLDLVPSPDRRGRIVLIVGTISALVGIYTPRPRTISRHARPQFHRNIGIVTAGLARA